MGLMSNEINGNNCFINNSIAISGNDCETLLLQTSHQNIDSISMPLIRQQTHEWTPIDSINIDMNPMNPMNPMNTLNPLIINTHELNVSEAQQQILIVSSAMDLINGESMVAKPSQVQIVSDLPIITTGTQLNVIQVPTNILLTDNLIVIPQEGITLEVPSIETITLSPNQSQPSIENSLNYQFNDSELIVQQMNGFNTNTNVEQPMALSLVAINDCIAINGLNKSVNNQNDFFNPNNQIIGIIEEQTDDAMNDAMNGSINTITGNSGYDINAFLASSLSSTIQEECDPNEAKQWHNDSLIAYRAMLAFKKVMPNSITPRNASCVQTK